MSKCEANPLNHTKRLPDSPTVAELADWLGGVKGQDANFAHSLAEAFRKYGRLTEKQEKAGRRLYRHASAHLNYLADRVWGHEWKQERTETLDHNPQLGTGTWREHFICQHCGAVGTKVVHHNYSGD